MANYKQITVAKRNKYRIQICKAEILKAKSILFLFIVYVTGISQSFGQLAALQKVPATAAPGSSFIVQISINRGSINGFMKFSQALPPGYTAVELDSKSGDFRYENNETKIIWLKAPAEVTYTATFKIKVPKDAKGSLPLGGKIIYVTNKNERKVFNLPAKKIAITNKPGSRSAKTENRSTVNNSTNKETAESAEKNSVIKTAQSASIAPTTTKSTLAKVSKRKKYGFRKGGLEEDVLEETEQAPVNSGKNFKVQIGAFRQNAKIKNVPEHSTIVIGDITKHFSGNFSNNEESAERKNKMVEQGFKYAFIVAFPGNTSPDVVPVHTCKNWWHCLISNVTN